MVQKADPGDLTDLIELGSRYDSTSLVEGVKNRLPDMLVSILSDGSANRALCADIMAELMKKWASGS